MARIAAGVISLAFATSPSRVPPRDRRLERLDATDDAGIHGVIHHDTGGHRIVFMKIGMRTRAYSVAADGSGAAEPITQAGTRSLGAMSLSGL